MGSLKRSTEGERNRGNTVRKGEVALNNILEMPACPERGGIVFEELRRTLLECKVGFNNFIWGVIELYTNHSFTSS